MQSCRRSETSLQIWVRNWACVMATQLPPEVVKQPVCPVRTSRAVSFTAFCKVDWAKNMMPPSIVPISRTKKTGATMANFSALASARHALLERAGWDVEADGLFGAPPITVVVGAEAHASVHKALGLLGMGRNRVVRVPVDGQGRMRADALPALQQLPRRSG